MVRWTLAAVAGLGAAVLVTGIALISRSGDIEADVAARTAAALSGETNSWASFTVDGRDVALTGAAPDEDLRRFAADRVERQFGVRTADLSATDLLPEAIPYVAAIIRDGGTLTLEGSAPSLPDRRRMVDGFTRAVPDLAYNDRLRLARGMPDPAWLETLAGLYPLAADLSEGRIRLEDRTISITGVAASNAAYDRLTRLAPALPPGYAFAGADVVRPRADPYVYTAVATRDAVVLSGFAPDGSVRNELFAAARTSAGRRPVVDRVDLASGAADGFADAAVAALDYLDLFAEGRIAFSGPEVSVAGRPTTPEAWRTLNAHLAAWRPAGFTVATAVDLPVVAPYTLSATRVGEQVTVTGFVPDEATADALKTAAARVAGLRGPVVETTLAAGAPQGYAAAAAFAIGLLDHLGEGTVVLSGTRISVSGAARSGAEILELDAAIASSAPAGYELQSTVTPPIARPFRWSMVRTADGIAIEGHVPSEAARTAIRDAAEEAAGDLGVADRTSLAGGAPAGVDPVAVGRFAADLLARLQAGRVQLDDATLSVSGATADALAGRAVREALAGELPAGVRLGTVSIDSPSLFQFRIERGLDAVTIDGTVSGPAMRDAVAAAAARVFGRADLEMALSEVDGLPEGAEQVALTAVRAAGLLATGTVAADGAVVQVRGKTFTGVGAARLASDLGAAIPSGFRLETSVGVARSEGPLDAPGCAAALAEVQGRNAILFDAGAAAPAADSHGLVDRLGGIALRCEGVPLTVEGAGPDGPARAAAVAAVLESIGVDRARMTVTTAPAAAAGAPAVVLRAAPAP